VDQTSEVSATAVLTPSPRTWPGRQDAARTSNVDQCRPPTTIAPTHNRSSDWVRRVRSWWATDESTRTPDSDTGRGPKSTGGRLRAAAGGRVAESDGIYTHSALKLSTYAIISPVGLTVMWSVSVTE
jgi:hypothetical protein